MQAMSWILVDSCLSSDAGARRLLSSQNTYPKRWPPCSEAAWQRAQSDFAIAVLFWAKY